jgi:hypothetical protein
MFTCLAIGATINAAIMVTALIACFIAVFWKRARPDSYKNGQAVLVHAMIWIVFTSPVCGAAVWLWETALG